MEKDETQRFEQDEVPECVTGMDKELNMEELSNEEKPSEASTTTATVAEPEYEYITGIKLFLVIASVTLVAFIMMLDMSIIVTVRFLVL